MDLNNTSYRLFFSGYFEKTGLVYNISDFRIKWTRRFNIDNCENYEVVTTNEFKYFSNKLQSNIFSVYINTDITIEELDDWFETIFEFCKSNQLYHMSDMDCIHIFTKNTIKEIECLLLLNGITETEISDYDE